MTAHEYSKQGGDDNDHPDDDSVPSFLKKAQEYFDAPAQLDDDYSDYPSFLKKARGYFNAPAQLDDDDPSDLDSRSASTDAKKPELELTDDNAHYDDEHDDKEDEQATSAEKYDFSSPRLAFGAFCVFWVFGQSRHARGGGVHSECHGSYRTKFQTEGRLPDSLRARFEVFWTQI